MRIDGKLSIILTLLYVVNSLVETNLSGAALCFLQILFVAFLFFNGRRQKAIFWHLMFMVTSYCRLDFVATEVSGLYNYFSLKLIGPITFSYVLSILLLLFSLKKSLNRDYALFGKMRIIFYLYACVGFLLGLSGLLFSDYYFDVFIDDMVYIGILIVIIELISRNDKGLLLKMCFDACIPLLIASVLGVAFNYIKGIHIMYGVVETYLQNSVFPFVCLGVLAIPQVKKKGVLISIFVLYLVLSLSIGASGKFFFNILLVAIVSLARVIQRKKIRSVMILSAIALFFVLFFHVTPSPIEGQSANKLHQVQSLRGIFRGDISSIDNSPYIRIASIMDIYTENMSNPVYFIAGRGYGGYFRDHLGILMLANLEQGGFKSEYIARNKFPTAHSTFATVPLLNGFGGFAMLLYLIVSYVCVGIKNNYLGTASLIWLLLMFYYNILIGIVGILFLYSSEYKMSSNNINL